MKMPPAPSAHSTHGCRSHLYVTYNVSCLFHCDSPISSPAQSVHTCIHAGLEKQRLLSRDCVWRKVIKKLSSCSAGWPWIWVLCLKATIMCKYCQIGGWSTRAYERCNWSHLAWVSLVVNQVRSWFIEALLDHKTKVENLLWQPSWEMLLKCYLTLTDTRSLVARMYQHIQRCRHLNELKLI